MAAARELKRLSCCSPVSDQNKQARHGSHVMKLECRKEVIPSAKISGQTITHANRRSRRAAKKNGSARYSGGKKKKR